MEDVQLGSLYQQVILDHYRRPRNKGQLDDGTVSVFMENPTCGDEIHLQMKIEDDAVTDVRFLGDGCSISQASVSIMTGLIKGADLTDADRLAQRFTAVMHGDEEAAKDKSLGNLRALEGVKKFPVRIKCALLAFDALQEALRRHRGEASGDGAEGPGGGSSAGANPSGEE